MPKLSDLSADSREYAETLLEEAERMLAPHVAGYIPKPRYRTVECDWFDPEDGAAKLTAEIRSDLPFGYIADIPLGGEASYQELWTVIAPHVRSWNALGLDVTTGTYQPVPPPAEIGVEAFRAVDPLIGIWIASMLKQTYVQAVASPKANSGTGSSAKPAGGPSKPNAPASASSNRATKSRPNRSA